MQLSRCLFVPTRQSITKAHLLTVTGAWAFHLRQMPGLSPIVIPAIPHRYLLNIAPLWLTAEVMTMSKSSPPASLLSTIYFGKNLVL